MFRVSSTHLQEDIVVHKQHMVPSLSIRVLVSCWYAAIEESNSILRINNIQCITLVIIVWSIYVCVCFGLDNKHLRLIIVKVRRFAVNLSQTLSFDFSIDCVRLSLFVDNIRFTEYLTENGAFVTSRPSPVSLALARIPQRTHSVSITKIGDIENCRPSCKVPVTFVGF